MKKYLFIFEDGNVSISDGVTAGDRGAAEEGVINIIRISTDYVKKGIACEQLIDDGWVVIE